MRNGVLEQALQLSEEILSNIFTRSSEIIPIKESFK